jgi:hypothetical protein
MIFQPDQVIMYIGSTFVRYGYNEWFDRLVVYCGVV